MKTGERRAAAVDAAPRQALRPGRATSANEPSRADELLARQKTRFSICTLVTQIEQYKHMRATFHARGFDRPDCEYLYLDNSTSNEYDAYSGLNLFLTVAKGEYIILCHQDIELITDGREELDAVIAAMDRHDPSWAVLGNSGGVSPGRLAIRITDPHGSDQMSETLPIRVRSLDENFLLVRRRANLALSGDLSGFHLYGADLVIMAGILGWNSYVIDFHIRHLSPGNRDPSLTLGRIALVKKYARAFSPRWVMTPCELLYLSGGPELVSATLTSRFVRRIMFDLERCFPRLMRVFFRTPPAHVRNAS